MSSVLSRRSWSEQEWLEVCKRPAVTWRASGHIGTEITVTACLEAIQEAGPTGALHVELRSRGGLGRVSREIAALLRQHQGPTTCHVSALCDSGAVLLLAACRHRSSTAYATFGLHPTQWATASGNLVDLGSLSFDDLRDLRMAETQNDYCRMISADTGADERAIADLCQRSARLTAEGAFRHKLIQEIQYV